MKLMGLAELAETLNVSRPRARQIANRDDFPAPVEQLKMGPVWNRATVERWVRKHRATTLGALVLLIALAAPVAFAAQPNPEKLAYIEHPKVWAASLATTVTPGHTVQWRSRRIGPITKLSLIANGTELYYEIKPKTNNCVGYAYGEGVAVRLTDCAKGKRTRYVRVRAVNAGIKPAQLRLRFANR